MSRLHLHHHHPDRLIGWTLFFSLLLHVLAGFGLVRLPASLSQATQPTVITVDLRELPVSLPHPAAVAVKPPLSHGSHSVQPAVSPRTTIAPQKLPVRPIPLPVLTQPAVNSAPLPATADVSRQVKSETGLPTTAAPPPTQVRPGGTAAAPAVSAAGGAESGVSRGTGSALPRSGEAHRQSQPSAAYFSRIRERLERNKEYPHLARRSRMEGKVTVQFLIRGDGSPGALHVTRSSGYGILDESALRTVRNSAPFPLPADHSGTDELLISVPLVFRLER